MSADRATFYYDGDCAMCLAFVRRVRKLDRRSLVLWTPYQRAAALPDGVSRQDMERAAHFVSDSGAVYEGFDSIRKLLLKIPALALLGMIMSIPGVSLLGRPAYRLIARRRRCILPTRE